MAYLGRFALGKTPRRVDDVLRHVVRSAARRIPIYRQILEQSATSVDRFRGVDDLSALPIIDKQALFHDTPPGLQIHERADLRRCVETCTSGSTGMPVRIYMSRAESLFRKAQVLAAWRGFVRLPVPFRIADLSSWAPEREGTSFARHPLFSILRLSNALPVDARIEHLRRYDPHVISSCPTDLESIARRLAAAPSRLRSVRLIALQGEVLHSPVRRVMEAAFACRVAEFYNCEEIGNVASQCNEDSTVLHVNTDSCIVEVVDESGRSAAPGSEGLLLLTSLYNCTMPLIRYRIGDRGRFLPTHVDARCACGSRRPKLSLIGGRDDDYVLLPSGQLISPRHICDTVWRSSSTITPATDVAWALQRFRVEQDAGDHLTVRVVCRSRQPSAVHEAITHALRDLDPELRCSVEPVDDLAPEPSGKFRRVIRSWSPDPE